MDIGRAHRPEEARSIVEECERLFCKTLAAVFSGERNLPLSSLPKTMPVPRRRSARWRPAGATGSAGYGRGSPGVFPASPDSSLSSDGSVGSGRGWANPDEAVVPRPAAPVTPRSSGEGERGSRLLMSMYTHFYGATPCSARGFVADTLRGRSCFVLLTEDIVRVLSNSDIVALGELCEMPNFECSSLVFGIPKKAFPEKHRTVAFLVQIMGCQLLEAKSTFGSEAADETNCDWHFYALPLG